MQLSSENQESSPSVSVLPSPGDTSASSRWGCLGSPTNLAPHHAVLHVVVPGQHTAVHLGISALDSALAQILGRRKSSECCLELQQGPGSVRVFGHISVLGFEPERNRIPVKGCVDGGSVIGFPFEKRF